MWKSKNQQWKAINSLNKENKIKKLSIHKNSYGGPLILCKIKGSCWGANKSVKDNFKKEFGGPVYDEYEEEYLWAVPKKLATEPWPADGADQDSMRSREVKAEKGDKGTEGDNLPLWYASF